MVPNRIKKTLIQEDLYKTRFGSKYAEYQFQDEVMTAIICLVIKNDFFLCIRTKKKIHANYKDRENEQMPISKKQFSILPNFPN